MTCFIIGLNMGLLKMTKAIQLRQVCIQDAKKLLAWRNDELTRLSSHNQNVVDIKEHQAWLEKSLKNVNRKLVIAVYQGDDIGSLRADYDNEKQAWQLSWTLAPDFRGQGLAKEMVRLFAKNIQDAVWAEVKETNLASVRVAEYAGLDFSHAKDNILYFSRS